MGASRRVGFGGRIGCRDAETLLHDGTGGGVLQELALLRKQMVLDRERGQGGFMKAAQNQFLLAGIRIDIADGEDSRNAGLEFLGVDLERLSFQLESPLRDRTQLRVQSIECQYLIGGDLKRRMAVIALQYDTAQFVMLAM